MAPFDEWQPVRERHLREQESMKHDLMEALTFLVTFLVAVSFLIAMAVL